MDRRVKRYLDTRLNRRAVRHWRKRAEEAEQADPAMLQGLRGRAIALRRQLDSVIRISDSRLALPRVGSTAMRKLPAVDWTWRPDLWRFPLSPPGFCGLGSGTQLNDEVKIFHDCPLAELTLRQIRNQREADLAPFGIQIDVLEFQGGFLSLVIDVPPQALADLTREHILRLDSVVQTERPLEVFARLNLRLGTKTEQMVREVPVDPNGCFAEFDLAYAGMDDNRIEAVWLDLIIENPRLNQITVRDVTFSRRLRAQL